MADCTIAPVIAIIGLSYSARNRVDCPCRKAQPAFYEPIATDEPTTWTPARPKGDTQMKYALYAILIAASTAALSPVYAQTAASTPAASSASASTPAQKTVKKKAAK